MGQTEKAKAMADPRPQCPVAKIALSLPCEETSRHPLAASDNSPGSLQQQLPLVLCAQDTYPEVSWLQKIRDIVREELAAKVK